MIILYLTETSIIQVAAAERKSSALAWNGVPAFLPGRGRIKNANGIGLTWCLLSADGGVVKPLSHRPSRLTYDTNHENLILQPTV